MRAADLPGPEFWFRQRPGSYDVVERPETAGPQLLASYDAASGMRDVVASGALLTPAGAATPLPIGGASGPPTGAGR